MIVNIVSAKMFMLFGAVPLRHYHIVGITFRITLKHIIVAIYTHNIPT